MLGLRVVAVFAMSAAALTLASPALAAHSSCNGDGECEKELEKGEKEEAKGKISVRTLDQYKYCPYEEARIEACIAGITSGGTSGGFFQLGTVEVPLSKPVVLQGGVVNNEELGEEEFFSAANGGETLESPELPVRKGLRLITPEIEQRASWPQALKESFKEALANHETSMKVKIEVAGTSLYGKPGAISTEHLLARSGPAFELPLKTRVISPWLERLGGGPCTIGNEEHPIWQYLTTEGAGATGRLEFGLGYGVVGIKGSRWSTSTGPSKKAQRPAVVADPTKPTSTRRSTTQQNSRVLTASPSCRARCTAVLLGTLRKRQKKAGSSPR